MDMDDPVTSRRSIRKYTDRPVADEHVEQLLRAAMAAPSAGNQQPWHFIVTRDREALAQVTGVHPYARMLPDASVAVLVCGEPGAGRWPQFWDQDCAAATENLLIEAQRLGLGAVWLGVHPLSERIEGVRAIFGIPPSIVPFAIVPLGWPAERKGPSRRFDASRVHHERW